MAPLLARVVCNVLKGQRRAREGDGKQAVANCTTPQARDDKMARADQSHLLHRVHGQAKGRSVLAVNDHPWKGPLLLSSASMSYAEYKQRQALEILEAVLQDLPCYNEMCCAAKIGGDRRVRLAFMHAFLDVIHIYSGSITIHYTLTWH
jgi:hypothetical protein